MASQGVAEPPQLEARAYGPDRSERDIQKLRAQVYEYAPGIVMYREAPVLSLFQIEVYGRHHHRRPLLRMVAAVNLLGAEGVLSGIQPSVAMSMVSLGIDLSGIRTTRDTEEALVQCQARLDDEA